MKVILISPVSNVTSPSFRTLAAEAARAGHDVTQVFLPDQPVDQRYRAHRAEFRYDRPLPESVLDDLSAAAEGAGFVGVSVLTNHFERAVDITQRLKRRVAAPIVWGGIHATVRPYECLQYADAVARGEADETLPEFLGRLEGSGDWRHTPGFFVKDGGAVVENETPAPPADLAALPAPLYQMGKDLLQIAETGRLVPFTDELLRVYTDFMSPYANAGVGGPLYMVSTSRGCPHACAYCCNPYLKQLHAGYKRLRWRPVDHIVRELAAARRRWPFLKFIWVTDDEFFAMPEAMLREFVSRYPKEVGLPFRGLASVDAITPERLGALVDAGFFMAEIGIESASERMTKAYRRPWGARDKVLEAAAVVNGFAPRFVPAYDLIIDNPLETVGDRLATLRLVQQLPRPYFLQAFSLTFYPGTASYKQARAAGVITDDVKQVYRKNFLWPVNRDYIYYLTVLHNTSLPAGLLRALAWRPFVWLWQYPPGAWLFKAVAALGRKVSRLVVREKI